MPKSTSTTHPKKDFSMITQAGLKAYDLATKHKAAIEARLPAGAIDGLAADLTKLGADVPGAKETKATAVVATSTQDEALAQGYAVVSAIRLNVSRTGAPSDVRKAYGVGAKMNAAVVKDVKAAIGQIVKRAKADPAEAAGLGMLPKDIDALEKDLAAITKADETQEKERAGAPATTKERNVTGNRILATVDRIAGAGVLEFAKVEGVRSEFEGLVRGGGGKKEGKGE